MSDARWHDVDADLQSAIRHFRMGLRIRGEDERSREEYETYVASMAFMHAMQAGYTSFEAALLRILAILGEERPAGSSWHRDLLRRTGRAIEGRPAILPADLLPALEELRSFRHRATHAYDDFEDARADPAAEAAMLVVDRLAAVVAAFRDEIDP